MSFSDVDIAADVARLREKWFGADAAPAKALDAEEEAVAARWLGQDEAARLARTTGGKKYRPAVVVVHWGYVPLLAREDWASSVVGDYWYVETFVSGRKHEVFRGNYDGCMQTVARFQRMGLSVSRNGNEAPPPAERAADRAPAKSKRLAMIDALRGFKKGRQ